MDEVQQAANLGFQVINFATNVTNTLTTVTMNSLEMIANRDPAAKILHKVLKNNKNLSLNYCSKSDSKKLEELINEAGVTAIAGSHAVRDPLTKEISIKHFVIYPSEDMEIVKNIINDFQLEEKFGPISTEELINTGDAIRCIKELDYNNAKLYTEHCEQLGIQINLKEVKDNKFNVYFRDSDLQVLDGVKMTVALELKGKAGEALIKQLDYEDNNFARITSRITQGKEDFEVADLDYHRLSVNGNTVTFYDKNKAYELNRKSPTFNEDICKVMASMKNPVDLSVEEFQKQQFYDKKKKKQFLYKKDREHGRPELTKDEYMAIKKMNENHELYEKKIALENPTQQLYEYSYTNNEMRMATFESFEQTNKEEEKDQVLDENRELEEEDKVFIKEAQEDIKEQESIYIEQNELASDKEFEEILKEIESEKGFPDLNMNNRDDREEEIFIEND